MGRDKEKSSGAERYAMCSSEGARGRAFHQTKKERKARARFVSLGCESGKHALYKATARRGSSPWKIKLDSGCETLLRRFSSETLLELLRRVPITVLSMPNRCTCQHTQTSASEQSMSARSGRDFHSLKRCPSTAQDRFCWNQKPCHPCQDDKHLDCHRCFGHQRLETRNERNSCRLPQQLYLCSVSYFVSTFQQHTQAARQRGRLLESQARAKD